ncbi:aminoacyl-histidine dipeptidase [Marinomonas mediterranea]|jgi:aminoacyl-histidine dipeptidase|uniref:Cytosol non-specific dipeptidase n=1 Tax=Marinomonas mediterranea (strain ATCC 700492 / JCM 21426 / NBRC 103028 / MMB-1) TaxID=717774 RepID=F2K2Q1_MARM1|nr:aminoacyl-histidine dipeptidase [Marinomonas mediterranea]ADZ91184.1 aminoacyl-histidine dipeptidase [Marinomonas mediterranea MMB-1]WCN09159.1 beta-Ala-His dipeptidase [Marinomonas mediterranea]WCN13235.1 beta-Ala-His dipeptidase [Marinomonas mediterranea]WCN17311.1 beta-Ala-His dipeptidase [Marinomonas mediterranea MMB-1]
MNEHLADLEPSIVWRHFQTLCNTPRPSYKEAALRDKLIRWAESKQLATYVDPVGNLIIRKPATRGMEDREGVVLQGHLDMVAQKDANIEHNFEYDPIKTQIIDGWVHAIGTTLGADNGIGVAAALAVLDSEEIEHGPIEALFTIEEESSLRGALQLEEGILQGKILLNLDSEDRGDVYIGCAGGVDINVKKAFNAKTVVDDQIGVTLRIDGLKGGHSGLDIHKGRASANVLLIRVLNALQDQFELSLTSFNGGTLRNAIARDAIAMLNVNHLVFAEIEAALESLLNDIKNEYSQVEPDLRIKLSVGSPAETALDKDDQIALLASLNCAPHGVMRMSIELEGVTETSCNLGVINLEADNSGKLIFSSCLLTRSLIDSAFENIANKAKSAFLLCGADVSFDNGYPGWKPDAGARLLTQFLKVHKESMGYDANVKVIHAGLECGIIGAKYPGMEMVSFGPNIRGAHSPSEKLEIRSVADFWVLLKSLLAMTSIK